MHIQQFPDLSELTHLQGTIIKLPKSDAHNYISESLEVANLMNDDQMLKFLEAYLKRHSISKYHDDKQQLIELNSKIDAILDESELVQDAIAEGNVALVDALKQSFKSQITNDPDIEKPFNFLKYRRDAKHKAKMFKMA